MYQSFLKWDSFKTLLSEEENEILKKHITSKIYKPKSVVFRENSTPHGIFIVKSGVVKLYKTGEKGKTHIFQLCEKSDVFGFHPIVNNTCFPDSSETLFECEILFIPKKPFLDIIQNNAKASFSLVQALSTEFSKIIEQELMLSQKNVRQRTAQVLLNLDTIFCLDGNEEHCIILSRQDLADLCGTTKESLVRVLSDFKKLKFIASDGKKTKVLQRSMLKEILYR